jgi:hypothetical protein
MTRATKQTARASEELEPDEYTKVKGTFNLGVPSKEDVPTIGRPFLPPPSITLSGMSLGRMRPQSRKMLAPSHCPAPIHDTMSHHCVLKSR